MSAEYEEKFIVINKKIFKEMDSASSLGGSLVGNLLGALDMLNDFCSVHDINHDQKYYVVNQDEPYAPNIIQFILDNEDRKMIGDVGYLKRLGINLEEATRQMQELARDKKDVMLEPPAYYDDDTITYWGA